MFLGVMFSQVVFRVMSVTSWGYVQLHTLCPEVTEYNPPGPNITQKQLNITPRTKCCVGVLLCCFVLLVVLYLVFVVLLCCFVICVHCLRMCLRVCNTIHTCIHTIHTHTLTHTPAHTHTHTPGLNRTPRK